MNNQRFITATHIIPLIGILPENPVLVFESDQLTDIVSKHHVADGRIEKYNGTLIPGFVNAHCHLELSHMKGKIKSGTGLTRFLHGVVTHPPVPKEEVLDAVIQADQEMWENGIVAVGDISNQSVTAELKVTSPISYHTFVEMFDFLDPSHADHFYAQYNTVYEIFRESGLEQVTRVPHSPYTVSGKLHEKLAESLTPGAIGSIHMLENDQESLLLRGKKSDYFDFFAELGYELDHFQPPGHGSMEQFLHSRYHPDRMLFVHNTVASASDLELMRTYSAIGQPYLVTCPNANEYIESRLPDYESWRASEIPICIGTDSYSSNHQLSVWSEICTIKSYLQSISWEELIRWACLHGAKALGMEDRLGSFEPGKSPGAVLLEHHERAGVDVDSVPRRII